MRASSIRKFRLLVIAAVFSSIFGCGLPGGGDESARPLRSAVGQMLLVGIRGERANAEMVSLIRDVKPGGILLFDYDRPSNGALARNISSPAQLRNLVRQIQMLSETGLFIAADVEGGRVNRLKPEYGFDTAVPTAKKLGAEGVSSTSAAAEKIARELKSLGINFNLAPVADVEINPESPAIGALERSFGADPKTVVLHIRAFVEAHARHGIITALKHFPGHGSASKDTHLDVTDITETYDSEAELFPYRSLIQSGYGSPVMTAHVINRNIDDKPATLSRKTLGGLLRKRLGFKGAIVSDDMQMRAIVDEYGLAHAVIEAINAGVDIITIGNQIGEYDPGVPVRVRDAIVRAVETGVITESRIYESCRRIMEIKKRYAIADGQSVACPARRSQ